MSTPSRNRPQLRRLAEQHRARVSFFINGRAVAGLAGDTVLTALLTNVGQVRVSEFGDGARAGFCNMAACQDCWVSLEDGTRLRACSEPVREGMRLVVG